MPEAGKNGMDVSEKSEAFFSALVSFRNRAVRPAASFGRTEGILQAEMPSVGAD